MKTPIHSFLLSCLLILFCPAVTAKALELPAIQVVPIEDTANGRQYELYIKLPETYDSKSKKPHPVIYIVDALWNMEVISGSIEYFQKDAILVGISWEKGLKPQRSRMRDYMPTEYTGTDYTHPTGQALQHLTFIQNDVIKYVESHYHTNPDKRTFYGYSAGGAFGAYILLTQPHTFKNYIIGSPSTLFGGHYLHEYAPFLKVMPKSLNAHVFLSVGTEEKATNIQHAFSLRQFLTSDKISTPEVEFKVIESADHGAAFPLSALKSLQWLSKKSD